MVHCCLRRIREDGSAWHGFSEISSLKTSSPKDMATGGDALPPTRNPCSPRQRRAARQDRGWHGVLGSSRSFIYLKGLCQGTANVHFPNFASIINQNWFYISLNIKLLAPGGSSSSYSKTSVSSFRIDVL